MRGLAVWRAVLIAALCNAPILEGAAAEAIEGGRAIAETHCARCHAIGKTGCSPHADAPPFRDLRLRCPVENLEEALAEGIMTGHADTPEFQFEPQQIGAFVAHVKSLEDGRKK